jgi:hypothetical protein
MPLMSTDGYRSSLQVHAARPPRVGKVPEATPGAVPGAGLAYVTTGPLGVTVAAGAPPQRSTHLSPDATFRILCLNGQAVGGAVGAAAGAVSTAEVGSICGGSTFALEPFTQPGSYIAVAAEDAAATELSIIVIDRAAAAGAASSGVASGARDSSTPTVPLAAIPARARFRAVLTAGEEAGWVSIRPEEPIGATAATRASTNSSAALSHRVCASASGQLRLTPTGSSKDTREGGGGGDSGGGGDDSGDSGDAAWCAFRLAPAAATYAPLSMWALPPRGRGFTFMPLKDVIDEAYSVYFWVHPDETVLPRECSTTREPWGRSGAARRGERASSRADGRQGGQPSDQCATGSGAACKACDSRHTELSSLPGGRAAGARCRASPRCFSPTLAARSTSSGLRTFPSSPRRAARTARWCVAVCSPALEAIV